MDQVGVTVLKCSSFLLLLLLGFFYTGTSIDLKIWRQELEKLWYQKFLNQLRLWKLKKKEIIKLFLEKKQNKKTPEEKQNKTQIQSILLLYHIHSREKRTYSFLSLDFFSLL